MLFYSHSKEGPKCKTWWRQRGRLTFLYWTDWENNNGAAEEEEEADSWWVNRQSNKDRRRDRSRCTLRADRKGDTGGNGADNNKGEKDNVQMKLWQNETKSLRNRQNRRAKMRKHKPWNTKRGNKENRTQNPNAIGIYFMWVMKLSAFCRNPQNQAWFHYIVWIY